MIVTALKGGLGNQMFQYALGWRLARDRNTILRLDASHLTSETQTTDIPRPYALGHFKIEGTLLTQAETAKLAPQFPRLRRRFGFVEKILPSPIAFVRQKIFSYDADIIKSPAPCYLDGYWQTEKYFLPVADDLHRQFQLVASMNEARQATANLIKSTNAVSVHVRRGDYVTNSTTNAFHGTCAPEWYDRAMRLIIEKIETPHFFIFSDDPDWARANLPSHYHMHFVDPQTDRRDFEDMHLMALCQHNIIANSSFSWWGAWLNANPDKIIIAPERWFANGHEDTQDITPPSWIRLP